MDKRMITAFPKLLKNSSQSEKLKEEGYVTFPFLDKVQTEQLSEYYFSFQKEQPEHFYSSTHSQDFSFRQKTSDFIHSIVAPLLGTELENYKLLGGAFVVKPANGKGLLPPHQDWNLVDERTSRSYNLWIPLTDVTIENGAVFVLPKSHAKISSFRGPGIASLFKNIEKEVWDSLVPLPMKCGEALLYDHALLHASPVNSTNEIRLGIVCGIIAADKDMQLYFKERDGIGVYRANEKFFMQQNPQEGPIGLSFVKTITSEYEQLNAEQYHTIFTEQQSKKRQSWIKKIFNIS